MILMKKLIYIWIIIATGIYTLGCESYSITTNENITSNNTSQNEENLKLEKRFKSEIEELNNVLYPFHDKASGKFGYMNKSGKVILKPQFDYAEKFINGCAIVRIDDKLGAINNKGNFEVKLSNSEKFKLPDKTSRLDDLINLRKENKKYKLIEEKLFYGIVDKYENYVVSPKYIEIKFMENIPNELASSFFIGADYHIEYDIFVGDYAVVNNGEKDILIDKNGNEILDIPFNDLYLKDDFIIGFDSGSEKVSVNTIDLDNLENSKEYFSISNISKDRGVASNEKGYVLIDKSGQELTKTFKKSYPTMLPIYAFTDGHKSYIFDRDGNEITQFDKVYDSLEVYSENLYLGTNVDGSGEYINKEGKVIKYYKSY